MLNEKDDATLRQLEADFITFRDKTSMPDVKEFFGRLANEAASIRAAAAKDADGIAERANALLEDVRRISKVAEQFGRDARLHFRNREFHLEMLCRRLAEA